MLHWLKLKYIGWDWDILSKTEILCLRLRYFVWDEDTLSETYKLLLPLQFHSIYSLCARTLFSPAINFFPPSHLLNSLAVHFITLALLPLLLKFLSPLTARLSSASICYIHFNPYPLWLSIATLTSHSWKNCGLILYLWGIC